VCPLFIRAHQPRIAGHIGSKDGGEATCRGHDWAGPLAKIERLELTTTRASRYAANTSAPTARDPTTTWATGGMIVADEHGRSPFNAIVSTQRHGWFSPILRS
jgi:hypothetical protein